jgi:vanillate O-demethylase monooxygenase subunit
MRAGEEAAMDQYPRNAWYMAAWDRDLVAGTPKAETILGEPIVLYRGEDGRAHALEDRCVHRLAPLSLGRCEGDNLRCMYHGLLFAPDGKCVEIPGQEMIPARAKVRAYPLVEKHNALWLWPGDAALADESLIPNFRGYGDPAWAMEPGRMDYQAPARLIHDNLMDLSHIAYVHLNSFSGGNVKTGAGFVDTPTVMKTLPNGVRTSRFMLDMPVAPGGPSAPALKRGDTMDVWTSYDFLVPGIFLQETARFYRGDYSLDADGAPQGEAVFRTFTCQAVTPLTEHTACYFFAYGPWAADADRKSFFAELGYKAFSEDRVMIEAQYKLIQASPDRRMMPMVMDKGVVTYEGVVKRMLRAEAEGSAAQITA